MIKKKTYEQVYICFSGSFVKLVSATHMTRHRRHILDMRPQFSVRLSLRNTVDIFFFFQAEDGIRDLYVTGVQTCALPISRAPRCSRLQPVSANCMQRPA